MIRSRWIMRVYIFILLLFFISACQTRPTLENFHNAQPKAGLRINYSPAGSRLFMDDENISQVSQPILVLPGSEYVIRVESEGFIPFDDTIRVPPGGNIRLEGRLARIATRERVSDQGGFAGWVGERLCYVEETVLFCETNQGASQIYTFEYPPFWMSFYTSGIYAQIIRDESPEILFFNPELTEPETLLKGWFSLFCHPLTSQIYLLGNPETYSGNFLEGMAMVEISSDGSQNTLSFAAAPVGSFAEGLTISSDGYWFVSTISGNAQLWRWERDQLAYQRDLGRIIKARFSPSKPDQLAYFDEAGSLTLINLISNQETLISPSVTAYQWFPDGEKIIYSRLSNNMFSTIWINDLVTNAEKIVSDASMVLGLVEEISLSPALDSLVYVNSQNRLERIRFDP
jgi:hypothetical protein